jgi:hypothetical protein
MLVAPSLGFTRAVRTTVALSASNYRGCSNLELITELAELTHELIALEIELRTVLVLVVVVVVAAAAVVVVVVVVG